MPKDFEKQVDEFMKKNNFTFGEEEEGKEGIDAAEQLEEEEQDEDEEDQVSSSLESDHDDEDKLDFDDDYVEDTFVKGKLEPKNKFEALAMMAEEFNLNEADEEK
jgi:hypothetical protein